MVAGDVAGSQPGGQPERRAGQHAGIQPLGPPAVIQAGEPGDEKCGQDDADADAGEIEGEQLHASGRRQVIENEGDDQHQDQGAGDPAQEAQG